MEGKPLQESHAQLKKSTIYLMAFACGAIAANLYYAQPLLETIARSLHTSPSTASLVVAITQGGYAIGLLFIVPLGDILNKKTLISRMLVSTSAALLLVALSSSTSIFMIGSLLVGTSAVVAQVIVPYASVLAPPAQRGRVVGVVMSGLLLGILLARTLSGVVAQAFGWHSVYFIASGMTLLLAGALAKFLPNTNTRSDLSYAQLSKSVVTMMRSERQLQIRSLYGFLGFGMFSVFWASAALLLSKPPYSYSNAVIGLFGLVGVAGALAANLAGKRSDQGLARRSTLFFVLTCLLAYVMLTIAPYTLVVLISATVLLDMGVQGTHITNQAIVFSLNPETRSRLSSAYMTSYFIGGSLSSAVSSVAFATGGWSAVGLVGILLGTASLLLWILEKGTSVSAPSD